MLPRAVMIQRWWDPEPVFRAVLVAMLLAFAWGFGAGCRIFVQTAKSQEVEGERIQRCAVLKTLECIGESTDLIQCVTRPVFACLAP